MSMPAKGKVHHLHHNQPHHSHLQSQHIIGVNINQSSIAVPHPSHYNPGVLNTISRFVPHSGTDFNITGQNFVPQPSRQVGGSGNSVGNSNGRGTSLGSIQSVSRTMSGLQPGGISSCQAQAAQGPCIQKQTPQGSSVTTTVVHSTSSQEVCKQTHIQNAVSSLPQVFLQNSGRSSSQNFYSTGSRSQQQRNINHRTAPNINQSQVVGIAGAGSNTGQPNAIFPHPGMAMQPSTVYVQGQVSAHHTTSHQQNVYSMNNQLPLQYSGPPQRHQTHQNQFPYQSYQTHALLATSNLFGYTSGTQHPGFFYHQASNTQVNLNRANSNSANNTQHISGPLPSAQSTTVIPQGTLQESQQSQAIHSISLQLPQNDVYTAFNSNLTKATVRSKKPRTKAITDIVNPNTGKNISAEIYKDDAALTNIEMNNTDNLPSSDCSAELLVADFAARVAKLASESASQSSSTELQNNTAPRLEPLNLNLNTEQIKSSDCFEYKQSKNGNTATAGSLEKKKSYSQNTGYGLVSNENVTLKDDVKTKTNSLPPNSVNEENSTIHFERGRTEITACKDECLDYVIQRKTTKPLATLSSVVDSHSANIGRLDGAQLHDRLIVGADSSELKKQAQESTELRINEKANNNGSEFQHPNSDGKSMQKQKNKNKIKSRELNRKGAEKEGTDMDAFVNSLQVNTSVVQVGTKQDSLLQKDIDKDIGTELTKDLKDKDNYESKKEKDISNIDNQKVEKPDSNSNENNEKVLVQEIPEKMKQSREADFEETVTDTSKSVERFTINTNKLNKEFLPSVVSQKNEENSKIFEFCKTSKIDKGYGSSMALEKMLPPLKYIYADDQWSPINTNGKKVYGREFLMKLQNDPKSKIKPLNLPDLDVVLKDTKIRNTIDLRFKDTNLGRHDSLFPGFVKSSLSTKMPLPNKKSHSGKPKASKPNVIHVSLSLREDVKLRETENAWKPARLVPSSVSEEHAKTEALYKRVRSVLNKLTPQKFETLINQVRELQIDTQERLQGVIDLVFEKAVDEPSFSVAYALMCKELSNMEVTGIDSDDCSSANFRKLILTRCQTEFEKNTVDENVRSEKLKEIEDCADQDKKKELLIIFEEEERRIRIKSVGNIRFIGELFKQNMLTSKIMLQCIRHLLNQLDEENLECLCKLLTTIGKVLESKNTDLSDYFKQMQQIANRKGKISSRIRFMLQDVIDLRENKWIPRRDDSNPKTMDQIQKEAESERLDIQLQSTSLSTPRKDERINERKRNRGTTASVEDGGWSQPVGRTRQVYSVETAKLKNKPPSVDDMQLGSRSTYQWAKPNPKMTTPNKFSYLENVNSEPDKRVPTIHLSGSRSTGPRDYGRLDYKSNYDAKNPRNESFYVSSSSYNRDCSVVESPRSQSLSSMTPPKPTSKTVPSVNEPQISQKDLPTLLNNVIEEYIIGEEDLQEAVSSFKSVFPVKTHVYFVHEIINAVLEKTDYHRNKTSQLLSQLLSHKCISSIDFKSGVEEIFQNAGDLIIDIPRLWKYLSKILVYPIINDTCSLLELKAMLQSITESLRSDGHTLVFIAELLSEILDIKGVPWTVNCWIHSDIQWVDLIENEARMNEIVSEYKLTKFVADTCTSSKNDSSVSLDMKKVHNDLLALLKESNFDDICNWIQINVNDGVKEPKFIRTLMAVILETSVEQCNDKWTFKVENFDKLQKLLQRYVDADDSLELQCLFAVQAYITKLRHPAGLIVKIMTYLCENNVLSNEAFLAWEKNEDPAEREGKSVALLSLKSFFIPLKEAEDISSGEEV